MKPTTPFLEVVPGPLDADPQIERALGAARAMAEPELENRARVSAALRLALSQPSASSIEQSLTWSERAERPALDLQTPGPRLAPHGAPRAARTPLQWLLLGGVLIGALGFWLGHVVGRTTGQREGLAARGTQVEAERLMPAPPLEATPGFALGKPSSAPESASAPDEAAPALAPSRAGETEGLGSRATVAAAKRVGPGAARTPNHAPPGMSFREVLDQLRRARQELENGQATLSLLRLSELDRRAGDILREEREMARVLALCATGQNEAARSAAALLSRQSPRSIYAMRLSSSCVADASDAP